MLENNFFQMRQQEVAHLLTELEEGNERALNVYANFKRCKDLFEEAIKQIEPEAQNEANGYAEKSFSESGFTFEKRNGSTRYSYSHIPEVVKLTEKLKEVQEICKSAFLASQKGILTASKHGEEIVFPKVSYSKDSLILKK
jgi:hypothetical protein